MINYDRFKGIGDSDDDDVDDELERTFLYPKWHGLKQEPKLMKFDVREEICKGYGGASHGDVVLTQEGHMGTVIGVLTQDGCPHLFFHRNFRNGAGPLPQGNLRIIGKISVPSCGLDLNKAPSETFNFLNCTFSYLTKSSGCQKFDIRDEVCMKVGSFRHGQVVLDSDGHESVTIGVYKDRQGHVALYFHLRGSSGAGFYDYTSLKQLVAVGFEQVQEANMQHNVVSPQEEPEAKRMRLAAQEEALKSDRKKFEEEKRQLFELASSASGADILHLNVGGTIMSTTRSTLRAAGPGSMLASMFSGSWGTCDSEGHYFLDADPEFFKWLLTNLRLKAIEDPAAADPLTEMPASQRAAFTAFGKYYAAPLFEGWKLKAGEEVKLRGLQKNSELNNAHGWVMCSDRASSRWMVRLKNGLVVNALESQLEKVSSAPTVRSVE